jgi:hypothetical protein
MKEEASRTAAAFPGFAKHGMDGGRVFGACLVAWVAQWAMLLLWRGADSIDDQFLQAATIAMLCSALTAPFIVLLPLMVWTAIAGRPPAWATLR